MHKLILSSNGEQVELYGDKGIRIVKISGISFDNTVSTSDLYGFDGSRFQSGRLKERNISLIVRYIGPTWKHEAHKNRFMKLFGHKDTVRIRYITDNIDYFIDGYVENIDTPPNVRPMVTQVSIICPDPYWRVSGENSVIIAGTEPCFEFPIMIPPEGMIFGRIKSELICNVENCGTADSGALWTITAKTACTDPKIENIDTGEFMQTAIAMETGDVLEICTERGKKSIRLTRDKVSHDFFNYRVFGSTFLQIHKGLNRFKYTVGSGDEHAVDITVQFDIKAGGI